MNELSRRFHEHIILDDFDDLLLVQGFIAFYVLKGYTIFDFLDTLKDVYQVPVNKAVLIHGQLCEALSNISTEGS